MSDELFVVTSDLTDDLRYVLRHVMEEDGMPYWRYVDLVLDYGSLGFDEAALANFVLYKTQLPSSRDIISWAEVDSALSELETP